MQLWAGAFKNFLSMGLLSVSFEKIRVFISCIFQKFNICKITSWSITVEFKIFLIQKISIYNFKV